MSGLALLTLTVLLTAPQWCLAVRCYKCTDHAERGNTTAGGASWPNCDEFTPDEPRFLQDACSDDSCVKKVVEGRVSRYCGPRLQEEGCRPLGGGVRCSCSEDFCNGGHRARAWLPLLLPLLPPVFRMLGDIW